MPGGYGTVGTPWGSSGSTYTSSTKNYNTTPSIYSSNYRTGRKGRATLNPQHSSRYGGTFTPTESGNWMDIFGGSSGMTGIGDLFGGIGGLAQGWGALKDAKLAREAFAQQQKQWEMNYESQRLVTNNAIANQNAWKQAQGRTDYGSYVGGKPSGTNYIG